MKKSAGCALLIGLLLPAFAVAGPRAVHRPRLEYQFLCDYKPENGMTKFATPRCGSPAEIESTPAVVLRKEMDEFWDAQDMRYSELTIVMYQGAFKRAHPPEKDPLPTTEELKTLDVTEICNWWQSRKYEAGLMELVRRKTFTSDDIGHIRAQQIGIGMSEGALLCSLGQPYRRNRTVVATGIHIQYVFDEALGQTLVYTDNGVVTSWQD